MREEVRAALGPANAESDEGARLCYRAASETEGFVIIVQGGESSGPIVVDILFSVT
jgi:hypothetical protein